ncbi:MAG TPA: hypothetical protein PLJ27_02070 [Polyangiaceae bacterium]|jgi:hypothetical protein|nr:MAG: hypothetical protein BWY17_03320 [Deltaproteobacteria bacterium ADurb.Bin207]HNS96924.1 hypothetical protein [Polyangiaceae bacterium]HNZ21078.1 hypothetical protein [Polyangiaceae bacterium]HOD22297.1 hypothetical protein [Polyangiaceae bacterium]HOE47848.1 hypothetical protein [Polyangiaceae bacterium]
MDAKGHPQRPLERSSLPIERITDAFLAETKEESPELYKYLGHLDAQGRLELGGVLGRFDFRHKGELDAEQRLMARRVLGRLHRPATSMLVLVNRVLDYLDLNNNALLEPDEVELCVEIFELFAHADSDNDTVSEHELELLYAAIRQMDRDDNHALDALERRELREALQNPKAFLERQRLRNPRVAELMRSRSPSS